MKQMNELIRVIERLRDPDKGCPWDLKQTPESLREYIIEEAHELVEAIDSGTPGKIREETGDLLLQILLISQIFKERSEFNLDDVAETLSQKMVRRHPHVFGDTTVESADEVKANWEKIKQREKASKSIISDYPGSMPPLQVAKRISEQASSVGFDWSDPLKALEKVEEEVLELKREIQSNNRDACFEEIGDLIFAVANVSRLLSINPDAALKRTNEKFKMRFRYIEDQLTRSQKNISETALDEMEMLWERAKTKSEPETCHEENRS